MKPEEALELVRTRRLVPFTDVKEGPESFVHAVTGEAVKGSWWGHAKGHEIFNLAGVVARECISVKLVGGKETLLHRSLFPALARIVTDSGWRKPRISALSSEARRLLDETAEAGTLRVDEAAKRRKKKTSQLAKPRRELELALVVHSGQEHTDSGHHVSILQTWASFFSSDVKRAAKALSLDAALEELRRAGATP